MKRRIVSRILSAAVALTTSFSCVCPAMAAPEDESAIGEEAELLMDKAEEEFEEEETVEWVEESVEEEMEDDEAAPEVEYGEDPELLGISASRSSVDLMVGKWAYITIYSGDETFTVQGGYNSSVVDLNWELGTEQNPGSTISMKAVGPGSTTVTVKSASGETTTIKVNVHDRVYVNGVSINERELQMNIEDEPAVLIAYPQPSNADEKTVTWKISDESIVSLEQVAYNDTTRVKVYPQRPGFATVTAVTDDGHYEASCKITVIGDRIEVTGLEMEKPVVYLPVSSNGEVKVNITPENATHTDLKWTSSNKRVAEVDEKTGVIKTGTLGQATITATTVNGISASCEVVVVSKNDLVEVKGITVNKNEMLMKKGSSETLSATISPQNATDQYVIWKSSDPKVVTVDKDGKITAVSDGTATVTAIAGDKYASCVVTVKTPVEKVTLEREELELKVGGTYKMNAVATPEDASNKKLIFASNNTAAVTVSDDGTVKAIAPGKAVISVSSDNDNYFGNASSFMIVTVSASEGTYKAEEVAEMITKLPEKVTEEDRSTVEETKQAYESLSEEQKKQIPEEMVRKLNDAVESLKKQETSGSLQEVTAVVKDEITGELKEVTEFCYFEDGKWIEDKYGFVKHDGRKFLVAFGKVAKVNGLAQDPDHLSDWYFCADGQVADYSGLAMYDDEWFYVVNGKLDTTYSGLVEYNGALFYVGAGRILREASGLVLDPNSPNWYFVANGQVCDYTGLAMYNEEWFYVVNGVLAADFSGDVLYNGGTFHVVNGMLQ